VTVLVVNLAVVVGLGTRSGMMAKTDVPSFHSLVDAVRSAITGAVPGLRSEFVASILLKLTFQTFTTWYSLYGR
jgi:hypothetical protein